MHILQICADLVTDWSASHADSMTHVFTEFRDQSRFFPVIKPHCRLHQACTDCNVNAMLHEWTLFVLNYNSAWCSQAVSVKVSAKWLRGLHSNSALSWTAHETARYTACDAFGVW